MLLQSIIRTLVPVIVGQILGLAVMRNVDAAALTELVTLAITAIWYAFGRLMERIDARWGWLLGAPGAPTYPTARLGRLTDD